MLGVLVISFLMVALAFGRKGFQGAMPVSALLRVNMAIADSL